MAKGWLDNYGKQENYNDSAVSLPEGFVGMGNNTKGRNYSPAWGGQFAMGGSLPGAVGFMYARTGAPSNGPKGKKTVASAENGKEMQYYQEGLDWQPKTISRNGDVIKDNRGQWDHPGEVTRISGGNITMHPDPMTGKPLTQPLLGISDTGEEQMMYPGEDYEFKGAKHVTEYPKGKLPKKAKNGVNQQDEKTLEHIDQLTNFTNYNKPTKGGWLDKY